MEEAEERLHDILDKAEKMGVPKQNLLRMKGTKKLLSCRTSYRHVVIPIMVGVLSVTVALVYYMGLHTNVGFSRAWLKWQQQDLYEPQCTIAMPDHLIKAFRPPEDCSICEGVTEVDKVSKITPNEFEDTYAYTGRPVVITDATENWTALSTFNFQFFKGVYEQSLEQWSLPSACQFFPYETEFTQLRDVFNMTEARANMKDGTDPWYIGWSNCDDRVATILREHYGRPYFLPTTAEGKKVDWIFMGSSGYGAKMHVDNVEHGSWQAQLTGTKKWVLEPPPECYYRCVNLEVTVEPGEIIVLDTNRWYHQTTIVSEDMSITIGAEYD